MRQSTFYYPRESHKDSQVPQQEIDEFQKQIGAVAYVETSALQQKNVDLCFETAINKFLNSGTVNTLESSGGCVEYCISLIFPCF